MHFLGIPTTRSATCVTSDTRVERDIYYTGNIIKERATIITRLAPTFLRYDELALFGLMIHNGVCHVCFAILVNRFGSFEIFKPTDAHTGRAGPSVGRNDILIQVPSTSIP
jgi:hypothetical protein